MGLENFGVDLTTCTFCPNLCLHTCPVSTAVSRDSVSPYGKMSLAHHVWKRHVELSPEIAAVFYECAGCRGCSEFCVHDVDVAGALFAARAVAVASGASPFAPHQFIRETEGDCIEDRTRPAEHYEGSPEFLFFPGARVLNEAPGLVDRFFAIADRLGDDEIACGEASKLDVGYGLWAAGFLRDMERHAGQVVEALAGARRLVVVSPEDLYCLKVVYPQLGYGLDAELLHVSEYLLPMIAGAIVERLDEEVAYYDSCHLARHLNLIVAPREVLGRVLSKPPRDLLKHGRETECCGATGCWSVTNAAGARAAAERVVLLAREQGVKHLTSFSPECVALLAEVAGDDLRISNALTLIERAVRSER